MAPFGGGDVDRVESTDSLLDGGKAKATTLTPRVFLFVGVAAIANILFGYENSVISGAKADFAAAYGLGKDSAEYGFLAGGMPIGATVACLFAGLLQDKLGRRVTLALCTLVYIGAAMVSRTADSFGQLAAGRVLTGLAIGAMSSTVPMYISELSPAALRGSFVTVNQVCVCTGILLGYAATKALDPDWRMEFTAGIPLAGLMFLAFVFVTPYSPRWLAAQGRIDEARDVLLLVRGRQDEAAVEAELDAIRDSLAAVAGANPYARLRERHITWAIVIGVMAALMQQWCGVNAVNAYAQDIFAKAGFSASDSSTQAIYIGVAKLGFVLVALYLMDRAGRKPLLLAGCAGMAVTLLVLGLSFQLSPTPVPKSVGYTASIALVLYMAFFEISLGPVLWLLLSELYPIQVKGVAMSIGSFTCWLMTYAVTQVFPSMQQGLGEAGAFLFFAVICALSFLWIWRYLPETRGRTLEEIEEMLKGGSGSGGKGKKKGGVADEEEDEEWSGRAL